MKEMLLVVLHLQLSYQVVHKIPTTPSSSSSSLQRWYIIAGNNDERLRNATHSQKIRDHRKRAPSLVVVRNAHTPRPTRSPFRAHLGQCIDTPIGCVVHPPAPIQHEQRICVPPSAPLLDLSPLGLPKLSPPK